MNPIGQKIIELGQLAKKESRQVDFKEKFDSNSAIDWSSIVKDLVAMANSGGGVLIFGITDNGDASTFDKRLVLSIDPAAISDKVHSYTGENFSEFKIIEVRRKRTSFAAILVSESETPIAFVRNGADALTKHKQKPLFLKGTVYFRHGAKSEPADTGDIKRAIDRVINKTRKSWFDGVRKISNIGASDEIIISKKNPALQGRPLTLAGLLRVSEKGTPVQLSHVEFEALRQEYPLEYKDVVEKCKKKKTLPRQRMQAYIDSCKGNQDLSINWKTVGKSLNLPFSVPDKFMYKEKVIENF